MDAWLILLRIVHVGSAMIWFGGAILAGFFLQPTAVNNPRKVDILINFTF